MSFPEDLEFEIEALRATYDDVQIEEAGVNGNGGGRSAAAAAAAVVVAVPVVPRGTAASDGSAAQQFVAARLLLSVPHGYPAEPPAVQLADAKGLGDARQERLRSALDAEAAALAGELSLGHLVETALDLLTASNQPEGLCAFCLEPLLAAGEAAVGPHGGAAAAAAAAPLLRLDCFHCFHTACFAPWWHWQQRQLAAREAQLRREYKAMAPLKLDEEGIHTAPAPHGPPGGSCGGDGEGGRDAEEASGGGAAAAYVLACPACRTEVLPASLAHAWHQLQGTSADSWSEAGGGRGGRAALALLPAEQRDALAAMQRRHAQVRQRQEACGGLVEATHSVSLSDLQAAATAAAAAEAAAAAAAADTAQRHGSMAGGRGGRGSGAGGQRGGGAAAQGRGRGRCSGSDAPSGCSRDVGAGAAAAQAGLAGLHLETRPQRGADAQAPRRQQQRRPQLQQQQQQQQQQRQPPQGGRPQDAGKQAAQQVREGQQGAGGRGLGSGGRGSGPLGSGSGRHGDGGGRHGGSGRRSGRGRGGGGSGPPGVAQSQAALG